MGIAADWWRARLTWRSALLLPVAWGFGLLIGARRALYRTGLRRAQRLPVPVIVIGNLVVGGTGKTPLTIALAQALRERGRRPGLVSRGYRGSATTPRAVSPDDDPAVVGDEPLLLARRTGLPVWIGADRVAAARGLLAAHPATDLLIADDGLQHLRLGRTVEIAVFDERGAGNGRMQPAGPLREPLERLATVDAIVVNGPAAPAGLPDGSWSMVLDFDAFHRLDDPLKTATPAEFSARRVAAVAGIGNPARFFAALAAAGIAARGHAFPDHHAFSRADLAAINADTILMTEKDAIKCAGYGDPRLWVAPVTARLPAAFIDAITEKSTWTPSCSKSSSAR